MDVIDKELESRKEEICESVELLFKANMTITDWDIPEVDDHEVAKRLLVMMQSALDTIKAEVEAGKYDYY